MKIPFILFKNRFFHIVPASVQNIFVSDSSTYDSRAGVKQEAAARLFTAYSQMLLEGIWTLFLRDQEQLSH